MNKNHPFIEILEHRIVPAGFITVTETVPGEFTFTGDTQGNVIHVYQTTPGNFRIEGLENTTLNPGGLEFLDVKKITKITFMGNDGADHLQISNLATLKGVSFDGGMGADNLTATNVTVTGNVNISGGAGLDTIFFTGLTAKITGDLLLSNSTEGFETQFGAEKTTIGGRLVMTGGIGDELLQSTGAGSLTIGKGVDFDGGAAGESVIALSSLGGLTIGKLPTGESLKMVSTGVSAIFISGGGNVTLTGGVKATALASAATSVALNSSNGMTKVGKLQSGASVEIMGNSGNDSLSVTGNSAIFAGGLDLAGAAGDNSIGILMANGALTLGKLPTGQSIRYSGGAAFDSLLLSAAKVTLAGGIEMNGGGGANNVNFTLGATTSRIGKLATGASLQYLGGSGTDTLTLDHNSLMLAGGIDWSPGDGTNTFTASGAGSLKVGTITATGASLKYTGGANDDTVSFAPTQLLLAGGVDFAGGNGTNTLSTPFIPTTPNLVKIGKLKSGGASVVFTGGTGSDQLALRAAQVNLAGGVDFSGGSGANDEFALSTNLGAATVGKLTTGQSFKVSSTATSLVAQVMASSLKTAGGAEVAGGSGQTSLGFFLSNGTATIGKLASGQSVLITGGDGGNSLSGSGAKFTFAGGLQLTGGNGGNQLNFIGNSRISIGTFGTGQSILLTGGSSFDSIDIAGPVVALKGSVEMNGNGGENEIGFSGSKTTLGKNTAGDSLKFVGGADMDTLTVEDHFTASGSITLQGGNGVNTLALRNSRLQIGGGVNFTGGTGIDTFDLSAFALSLAKGVNLNLGDSADSVSLRANGVITGDTILNVGGVSSPNQKTEIGSLNGLGFGLVLKGLLTISSASFATGNDDVTLENLSVAKALAINLGAGTDDVVIDNLQAGDTLDITTGAGLDSVEIERGNFFGNSIIAKLATILTGSEDDELLIGSPFPAAINSGPNDSTRVRFLGGLTADGGSGTDDISGILTENDFPTGNPTTNSFENVVP